MEGTLRRARGGRVTASDHPTIRGRDEQQYGHPSTTIHPPFMAVSKIATSTVNADEATTYTITYGITSVQPDDVLITDTMLADCLLQRGARPRGPEPDASLRPEWVPC